MATQRRSADQNKRYWALVGRLPDLRANEENRRSITLSVTGNVSTRNLSVSEMNGLCEYLEYLLGEKRLEDVEFPNRISRAQVSEISRLEHELAWHTNPARLEGLNLRITQGREKLLKALTRLEAQKVLNCLVAMAKRQTCGSPALG